MYKITNKTQQRGAQVDNLNQKLKIKWELSSTQKKDKI
jgi:hypothetical protein